MIKRTLKIAFKSLKIFLSGIVLYFLSALVLTIWTINENQNGLKGEHYIYLETSGVHADFVFETASLPLELKSVVKRTETSTFTSFGWGDENFYLNTPTWADLTLKNACTALFWKSNSMMHVTEVNAKRNHWIKVRMTQKQFKKLSEFIIASFAQNQEPSNAIDGYSRNDYFYRAKGSYSCFNTCNSWVNNGMKRANMKAAVWTPFDFGIINKYK